MKITLSKNQWETMGKKAGWMKESSFPAEPQTYFYHINLNERGSFFADVRNSSGTTLFEIKAGNKLEEGESSIFEDGFMKNMHDMDGLKDYLISLGIMNKNQKLKDMSLI